MLCPDADGVLRTLKFRQKMGFRDIGMSTSELTFMSKSQVGFTLIELMVTISVVAVLIAIAVPSFNQQIIRQPKFVAVVER